MANDIAQVNSTLNQILAVLTVSLSKVMATGSGKIISGSGPQMFQLNPNYYTDVTIVLSGGTATDTNVWFQMVTDQPQMPANYLLNSTVTKIRVRGIQANNITADATLTSGQTLYIYFIGYSCPISPSIKA